MLKKTHSKQNMYILTVELCDFFSEKINKKQFEKKNNNNNIS